MTQINAKKIGEHQQLLIDGLDQFPATWALTPVYGDKIPYRKNWQAETPIAKQLIERDIRNGKARGYGLRTGTVSGGIVAVDADGHAPHDKINELSGGVPLPETVAFTSNKPGRCQYLFYVPQEYWGAIATKKISTGVKGDDGKEQKLELRWDGCQSVLPPSVHPETGCYRWRRSPEEVAIAPCPMWIIEQMLNDSRETTLAPLLDKKNSTTSDNRTYASWTDRDWALSYLNALSSSRADDYDDWLAVGMALHSADDSLLVEWDNWSRQSQKYTPGCCEKKWKSFKRQGLALGTLGYMAKQDGWQSPKSTRGTSNHKNSLSPHHKLDGGSTGSGSTGSGGNDGNDWGDGDGGATQGSQPPNQWQAPTTWNGEIGWLIKDEDENGLPITKFFPKCNFDFQIESELSSDEGGGLVLQMKRSLDTCQKRVIISSQDYGSTKDFEAALKRVYKTGVVCNLKTEHLKALIHVKLLEYRARNGITYRLQDRAGQQEDGHWVFEDCQITPDGDWSAEPNSDWIFNADLGGEDKMPQPKIAPPNPDALKRLVAAMHKFHGAEGIFPCHDGVRFHCCCCTLSNHP
jgi:hypothetical protein